MKAAGPRAASNAAGEVQFTSTGFGVEPCSKCGGRLLPGQLLATRPGEWRTFHVDCPLSEVQCDVCGDAGVVYCGACDGVGCEECQGTGDLECVDCPGCSICGEGHKDGVCLL